MRSTLITCMLGLRMFVGQTSSTASTQSLINSQGNRISNTALVLHVSSEGYGHALMLQGVNNSYYHGHWMFPGGKVDGPTHKLPDSSLEYGVVREFLEETGLPTFPNVYNVCYYDHRHVDKTWTRLYFATTDDKLSGFNIQTSEIQKYAFAQICRSDTEYMDFTARKNQTLPVDSSNQHLYVKNNALNSYGHARKNFLTPNSRLRWFTGASLVNGKLIFPQGHPDFAQAPQAPQVIQQHHTHSGGFAPALPANHISPIWQPQHPHPVPPMPKTAPTLPTVATATLPGGFRKGDQVRRTTNSANGLFKIGDVGTVMGPKGPTHVMVNYPHVQGHFNSITSITLDHPRAKAPAHRPKNSPMAPSLFAAQGNLPGGFSVGEKVYRTRDSRATKFFTKGKVGTVMGAVPGSNDKVMVDYPGKTGDWNTITSIRSVNSLPACKCGCGNPVNPPDISGSYDVCCTECTLKMGHSKECYNRSGKTPCTFGCMRPANVGQGHATCCNQCTSNTKPGAARAHASWCRHV